MQTLINMVKSTKLWQRFAVLTFALIWLTALLDYLGCPNQFVGAALLSLVMSALMTIVCAGTNS